MRDGGKFRIENAELRMMKNEEKELSPKRDRVTFRKNTILLLTTDY